jgi:hypothetical protein
MLNGIITKGNATVPRSGKIGNSSGRSSIDPGSLIKSSNALNIFYSLRQNVCNTFLAEYVLSGFFSQGVYSAPEQMHT